MTIQDWLPEYKNRINREIEQFFATRYRSHAGVEKEFEEALAYAVEGGGKRLRVILVELTYEYAKKEKLPSYLLRAMLGIECIHAYTLVHDDLPCMDNDELRRGKPTVWKKYGETMAVLIGDTLQTLGFELLSESRDIRVIAEISRALGDMGVARGQIRDTFLRHDTLSLDELLRLHDEKTGGFIAVSLVIGGLLAGASDDEIAQFRKLGYLLGRAYQIQDDIIDYEGESAVAGKKTGKDVDQGKGIVSLIGIDMTKNLLQSLMQEMYMITRDISDTRFADMVEYIGNRKS